MKIQETIPVILRPSLLHEKTELVNHFLNFTVGFSYLNARTLKVILQMNDGLKWSFLQNENEHVIVGIE